MHYSRRTILKQALAAGVSAGLFNSKNVLAQQLEAVHVRLDWNPWGVHSAFHLATVKGWYKAAGLDVDIEDGNGSVTTVQLVGSGGNFDVGHASLSSMMIAKDKGLGVKAIGEFTRKSDIGVIVPVDSPIKTPADLRGKKVIYTAGSLEAPFIDTFLAAGGLKRTDVDLVNVDAASKASTYAIGRADGVFSAVADTQVSVSVQRPSRSVLFADYGLHMPSFGLFTSDDKLKSKRAAIGKFASVTARTWEYIYAGHEDEAIEAMLTQRPQARLDRKILRGQIDSLKNFFAIGQSKTRFGVPIADNWVQAVKTISTVGLIKAGDDPKSFYDADLIRPQDYDSLIKS
jgi:NitT/TauT family transport system substrate-binding protein